MRVAHQHLRAAHFVDVVHSPLLLPLLLLSCRTLNPLSTSLLPQVLRRERHFSQFTRSFALPDAVKEDGISASLEQGVLRVTVPKAEPTPKPQPKRIQVTAA